MYVVFVEELDAGQEPQQEHVARTLDQAFAMIVCRCGYSYRFEPAQEQGWCLFLIDVERPERSPDPLHSTCIKPRDAQHDLMRQAVDGRLKGHVALERDASGGVSRRAGSNIEAINQYVRSKSHAAPGIENPISRGRFRIW